MSFFLAHVRTQPSQTQTDSPVQHGTKVVSLWLSLSPSHSFCLPVLSTTPSLTQGTHSFSQRTPHMFTNLAETPAAEISPFQERLKLTFLQKVHKRHWLPQCCSSPWGCLGMVPDHWRPGVSPAFVTVCIVLTLAGTTPKKSCSCGIRCFSPVRYTSHHPADGCCVSYQFAFVTEFNSFPFSILILSINHGVSSVLEWSAGSKPAKKSLMFHDYEEFFWRGLIFISLVNLSL